MKSALVKYAPVGVVVAAVAPNFRISISFDTTLIDDAAELAIVVAVPGETQAKPVPVPYVPEVVATKVPPI